MFCFLHLWPGPLHATKNTTDFNRAPINEVRGLGLIDHHLEVTNYTPCVKKYYQRGGFTSGLMMQSGLLAHIKLQVLKKTDVKNPFHSSHSKGGQQKRKSYSIGYRCVTLPTNHLFFPYLNQILMKNMARCRPPSPPWAGVIYIVELSIHM